MAIPAFRGAMLKSDHGHRKQRDDRATRRYDNRATWLRDERAYISPFNHWAYCGRATSGSGSVGIHRFSHSSVM